MTATGNMAILPGISSIHSIEAYHRSQIQNIGAFEIKGPMSKIRSAAIQLSGLDYQFSCVQDYQGNIIHLAQGEPIAAWNEGVAVAERLAKVPMKRRYDTAVVAPGTNRDSALYSSIDALCVGSKVTRQNGSILLVADCSNGLGPNGFSNGVECNSMSDLNRMISDNFQLGMKKAALLHEILETRKVIILSENLDGDSSLDAKCTIVQQLDEAMTSLAISNHGSSMVVIPQADWIDPDYT